jgi:hypothetical protein
VNDTQTTPAPAVGGRQVGQQLAGRYRLAMFKGGDDIADVWHALDESTEKVVTLEILRDRNNEPARQRFLAEAHRMAAIERPSVMRVAAIHNEAADTFIVFEHLIPLPVVLTGLTAVARDTRPATKAAEEKTAVIAAAPPAPAPAASSTLAAVAGPTRTVADSIADVAIPPTIVEPAVLRPAVPQPALSQPSAPAVAVIPAVIAEPVPAVAPSPASPDVSDAAAWRTRLTEEARALLRDVGMDTVIDDARAFIAGARARISQRFDTSLLTSLVERATPLVARVSALAASVTTITTRMTARTGQAAGRASKARSQAARLAEPAKARAAGGVALPKMPSLPRVPSLKVPSLKVPSLTVPSLKGPSLKLPSLPKPSSFGTGLIPALGSSVGRVLGNRLVLGAAGLIVVAVVVIATPLDDAVTSALASRPGASPTVTPQSALQPAPFVLPPLSEYGATFESQGAYPTTTPNGTVEWVVALRNTGSAGWHRGIEGAQAALALPDGTGVAVQSTPYVAPGQVGWFVVHFKARAEVGTYTVQLLPRIDGRGPMPELGIFTVVTVAKNP